MPQGCFNHNDTLSVAACLALTAVKTVQDPHTLQGNPWKGYVRYWAHDEQVGAWQ